MRIRRIRLALPAHMKTTATADARVIAEAIAGALGSGDAPARLSLTVDGHGRPARHLTHDVALSARQAAHSRPVKG